VERLHLPAVVVYQMADRHAPGLANRGAATWQRHIVQMGDTLKANMGGDQYFSAPDRSIGSVSCAIKRDPNHFSIQMIFSHAGNDVGVMMLHRNMLEVFALQRPLRREIIGMQIVRDDSRLHFQYPLK